MIRTLQRKVVVIVSLGYMVFSVHAYGGELVFDGHGVDLVDCDGSSSTKFNTRYAELACGGIKKMQENKFVEAARLLEAALSVDIFESPNFSCYPG